MAILAQCPICTRKQSLRNKRCAGCSEDLDKLKRQKGKVLYWIDYRIPGKRQRREVVGYSIEEARAADGLRKSQKRQNHFFDMLPESNWTFIDLKDWYLDIDKVKETKTYDRIKLALTNFADYFGSNRIKSIVQLDLERYQKHRQDKGRAPATIDMELKYSKAAVKKAFYNEKVDGRILRAFENTKLLGVKGENARSRIIGFNEYIQLLSNAPDHLKNAMILAFNTGMRKGEILGLKWKNIDDDLRFIRLKKTDTKEGKPKIIPLNHHVQTLLSTLKTQSNGSNVITYYGKPITQKDALKKSLASTCKKAGLPYGTKTVNGIIFHDSRRSFKTNMILAGIAEPIADTILGHSLLGMNKHYIKPDENALRETIVKFTKWLDAKMAEAEKDSLER